MDIPQNAHLFSVLGASLSLLGALSAFSPATLNSRGMGSFYSEGVNNVFTILLPLLYTHQHFMYWKFHRFELMRRLAILMASNLHITRIGVISALKLIYSYPNERHLSLEE